MRRRPLLTRCITPLRNNRGQSLAETGIVIGMFVLLTMGLIEFGRAWMVSNMITHAAREGARMAAVVPPNQRTNSPPGTIPAGTLSTIATQVSNEIRNVGPTSGAGAVNVSAVAQQTTSDGTANGIPVIRLRVTGSISTIFNLVGTSFSVDRSVYYRDEGR